MTQAQHTPSSHPPSRHTEPTAVSLDALDEQLIVLLERDGRMSYADIGTAVGLTPGGARARVMRLQEKGVIRVTGITSPAAVGLHSIAALHIEVDGDIDTVADHISQFDGVRYLVLGTGRYSILVEAYAATPAELFTLINRHIRDVPGVKSVETFTYETVHTHRPVSAISSGK